MERPLDDYTPSHHVTNITTNTQARRTRTFLQYRRTSNLGNADHTVGHPASQAGQTGPPPGP